MGNNQESAEQRAEAAARRAEARAEAAAAAAAAAQAAQASQAPPLVAARAVWKWRDDPLGDDPDANYDDGEAHPEEAAIANREASREARIEAWANRAERLRTQRPLDGFLKAYDHWEYWLSRAW